MLSDILELKNQIDANYILDIFIDPYDILHINHNNVRIDIEIIKEPYFSAHCNEPKISDNFVCENNEVVLYALIKYCKDVHRWGEFQNN